MKRQIKVHNITIGEGSDLVLIAGPCVIENRKLSFQIAQDLKKISVKYNISFIFKASYDKANRTSIRSFRGPGINKGIEILKDIKEKLNLNILTDVHCRNEIKKISKVADIIQIPAFLSRQTDLIVEVARTQKVINIKKGQFLAPWDIEHVIDKVKSQDNDKILITERGTCFGYNNLVVDFRALSIMKKFGYPVIFDATHSVQKPGGKGKTSSGDREFVSVLTRAAVAAGCDGIYLEVHPEPHKALSDGPNMINLEILEKILTEVKAIQVALGRKR